jgi:hypothetical protein
MKTQKYIYLYDPIMVRNALYQLGGLQGRLQRSRDHGGSQCIYQLGATTKRNLLYRAIAYHQASRHSPVNSLCVVSKDRLIL